MMPDSPTIPSPPDVLDHPLQGLADHGRALEKRQQRRNQFFAIRRIAPFDGERIPSETEFFSVESRDMTSVGFACFLPQRPTFDSLVVAVGSASSPEYVVAEVVHCTDVLIHSSGLVEPITDENAEPVDEILRDGSAHQMVLVGCRFTRRL